MKFWIFIVLVLEQKGVKRMMLCTSQFENRPPPPPNRGIWPKVRPTQSSIWLLCQNAGLQCRQQKDFVILSTFCCAPHSWVIAPIFTVMLEHLRKPVKCGGRGLHGQFWNWVVQYGHLIWWEYGVILHSHNGY